MAVCIDLWTQDGPSSFHGRWVHYDDVGANPLPVQRPHIPIWVGGKTPAAMRRVGRYGTGYHTIGSTPAQLADEVAAVHAELERAGRDPGELVVSMLAAFLSTSGREELIDALGEYERAGLHHLVGIPLGHTGRARRAVDPRPAAGDAGEHGAVRRRGPARRALSSRFPGRRNGHDNPKEVHRDRAPGHGRLARRLHLDAGR